MAQALFGLLLLCATAVWADGPVTYAWRVDCGDWSVGLYATPDACTAGRRVIAETCEQPVRGGQPNPAFVRIADICKESLNGRGCSCVYAVYMAQPAQLPPGHQSVLDVWRAADTTR